MALDAPLRIVLVEDNPDDCALVTRVLRELPRAVEMRHVDSRDALLQQLQQFQPDLVLSDHTMPGFGGHQALGIVRQHAPGIPFIFVSGTIGEEAAIEALQRGAVDYVLKDNLRRLPSAILNALALAEEREQLRLTGLALAESEERFRAIIESTEDWVWETDLQHRIVYSNASVARMLGVAADVVTGRVAWAHVPDDARDRVRSRLGIHLAAGTGWRNARERWLHADGSIRWLEGTATPRIDAEGRVCGMRGIERDITQRLADEAKIRQLARFHAVLGALGSAVLRARDVPSLLDQACRLAVEQGQFKVAVVQVPDAAGRLVVTAGAGARDIIASVDDIGPADPADPTHRQRPSLQAFLSGERAVATSFQELTVAPELHALAASLGMGAHAVLPIGNPPWAVLSLSTTEAREFEDEEVELLERMAAEIDHARDFLAKGERLEYLAFRDPVTGLINRNAFQAGLAPVLSTNAGVVGAVKIVRFRQFRDLRGRTFEDAALAAIGARLDRHFGQDGVLAHAGGPVFTFWRPCATADACMEDVLACLAACCAEPVTVAGEDMHFALRCGIVLADAAAAGVEVETVERNAYWALAEAERLDVVAYTFSDELHARAERQILLERELRAALAEEQFVLHLQPKFDCASGTLLGAEALMRWNHPVHGMISPAEFIPLLESTGLIVAAGQWLLATAVGILRRWHDVAAINCRLAINVSARELREHGFLDNCREQMRRHGIATGLDIEVTESILMEDVEQNIAVFRELRGMGCGVAIDDFGTGYSSLNYLSRLPADVLKIDRSFIAELADNQDTLALVGTIISLAHSLRLRVVAEGVETEAQQGLLRTLGCDVLQGYLLGRPLPVEAFEARFLASVATPG